jgi:pilus assembly protein CpaE
MNSVIDIVVLDDGGADEHIIRTLLSADTQLNLVDYFGGIGHHMPGADVVVVACGEYGSAAAALIRDCVKDRPTRPVVVVTQGHANGSIESAFADGAADMVFLPQPCDSNVARSLAPQVRFTLGKALADSRNGGGASTDRSEGRMVVMLGPKGGSGKTLATTNLAAALADMGNTVAVVDVDLQFGDVGLALGLAPDTTIHDLIGSGGSLDVDKLDAFLIRHASGARALLAPRRPDEAGLVTVDFLREVYALLRSSYDVVIVDTPPSFTPEVISAIDASSDVCIVAMLDSLSLKNTRLGLETLGLMDYPDKDIRFLLNRADSQVGITLEDVRSIVGRAPDVMVPSEREITRSVNEGTPIVLSNRDSDAAKAFRKLAELYANSEKPVHKRRRWLTFRRRR